ncbi:unnamed protein product [Amoebophrya sp. A25]|nr:unnamed protein product [Amoebophrya sp. A25]|eukprot:GSA25T00022447001.1
MGNPRLSDEEEIQRRYKLSKQWDRSRKNAPPPGGAAAAASASASDGDASGGSGTTAPEDRGGNPLLQDPNSDDRKAIDVDPSVDCISTPYWHDLQAGIGRSTKHGLPRGVGIARNRTEMKRRDADAGSGSTSTSSSQVVEGGEDVEDRTSLRPQYHPRDRAIIGARVRVLFMTNDYESELPERQPLSKLCGSFEGYTASRSFDNWYVTQRQESGSTESGSTPNLHWNYTDTGGVLFRSMMRNNMQWQAEQEQLAHAKKVKTATANSATSPVSTNRETTRASISSTWILDKWDPEMRYTVEDVAQVASETVATSLATTTNEKGEPNKSDKERREDVIMSLERRFGGLLVTYGLQEHLRDMEWLENLKDLVGEIRHTLLGVLKRWTSASDDETGPDTIAAHLKSIVASSCENTDATSASTSTEKMNIENKEFPVVGSAEEMALLIRELVLRGGAKKAIQSESSSTKSCLLTLLQNVEALLSFDDLRLSAIHDRNSWYKPNLTATDRFRRKLLRRAVMGRGHDFKAYGLAGASIPPSMKKLPASAEVLNKDDAKKNVYAPPRPRDNSLRALAVCAEDLEYQARKSGVDRASGTLEEKTRVREDWSSLDFPQLDGTADELQDNDATFVEDPRPGWYRDIVMTTMNAVGHKLNIAQGRDFLALRALIPYGLRSGHFLNFGLQNCDEFDPLFLLLSHRGIYSAKEYSEYNALARHRRKRAIRAGTATAEDYRDQDLILEPSPTPASDNDNANAKISSDVTAAEQPFTLTKLLHEQTKHQHVFREFASLVNSPPLKGVGFDPEWTGDCTRWEKNMKYVNKPAFPEDIPAFVDDAGWFVHDQEGSEKTKTETPTTSSPQVVQTRSKRTKVIEFVKVDIDSHDYDILKSVVEYTEDRKIDVLIYCVEVNGLFHPPLRYWGKSPPAETRRNTKSPAPLAQEPPEPQSRSRSQTPSTLQPQPGEASSSPSIDTATVPDELSKTSNDTWSSRQVFLMRNRHMPFQGMSLQAAVDLLRETHSLVFLHRGEDAYFVHNTLLRPIVEAAWNVRLPVHPWHCMHATEMLRLWPFDTAWSGYDVTFGNKNKQPSSRSVSVAAGRSEDHDRSRTWSDILTEIRGNLTGCDAFREPDEEKWPIGRRSMDMHISL